MMPAGRAVIRSLTLFLPLAVLVSVWYPEVLHYHVGNIEVSPRMIEEARNVPADGVLDELAGYDAGLSPSWDNVDRIVRAADRLLAGDVDFPGVPPTRIARPFDPRDLERGLPAWQLQFSGLLPAKVLLDAFRATGRKEYLRTARDMIVELDDFERGAWIPRGLLWNDHAVSSRVYVLVDFWSLYRSRAAGDPAGAAAVLRMANRYGGLLAKPGYFTYATNHGVFQNLALWHLRLAFPFLPGSERFQVLAMERLRDQISFYIGPDGVVLEHSAGYHQLGIELLGRSFRYFTMSGIPVPPDWADKYRKALGFYRVLQRPDGSLPAFGDTLALRHPAELKVTEIDDAGRSAPLSRDERRPENSPWTLKPVSGYAVVWDGLERQSTGREPEQAVVLWSYLPGHGHKHADEMSIIYWAGGRTWWTATGYWPYGVPGRAEVEGWRGSNAPHLEGEGGKAPRSTSLRYYSRSRDLAMVDLVRQTTAGYAVRRQVLRASPGLWVVIDTSSGADGARTVRTWTVPHDTRILEGTAPGSFRIEPTGQGGALQAWVLGSEGLAIRTARGRSTPFAGWEVFNGIPLPAPAIEVSNPADGSYAGMVWFAVGEGVRGYQGKGKPTMRSWVGEEDWNLELPVVDPPVRIQRRGNRVTAYGLGGEFPTREIILDPGPDVQAERSVLRSALEATARKYPKYRDILPYRYRVSYGILALLAAQEIILLLLRKRERGEDRTFQILMSAGWVLLWGWLRYHYFVT